MFPDTPFLSESSSYPHHHILHTPIVVMQFFHRLLLLGLAHHLAEKRRGILKHSCYRKDFFRTLSIEERCCHYQKIPQCSLIPLKLLPWQKLLASRNDQAYITMMGFTCKSFDKVLEKFSPMFSGHTPFNKSGMIVEFEYVQGRRRVVQPENCFGLVLVWTCTRGLLHVLQLVFGLTYSNLSVYLRFGICIIVETFRHNPLARVSIPLVEEIESFKVAFAERYQLLNDCWATMDGLKLYLQTAGVTYIQERFYNGWTHDHYVTSVFCFCPNGMIPISFFNAPESVHDSQVAEFGNIYNKLEEVYHLYGAKCCVDSAFGHVTRGHLYKLCHDLLGSNAPTRELRKLDLCKRRQATSARQTAEWGMRMFQTSFPRVKDRLICKERGERRICLKMLVLLYNMRARIVGINQIRNTYMKHLMRNAKEDVLF